MSVKTRSILLRLPVIAFLCLFPAIISFAQPVTVKHNHSDHERKDTKTSGQKASKQKLAVPDVQVITQDGDRVRFFSDLIRGKRVLINFTYTSCNLTCPMAGRNFQKLQQLLGKDLGTNTFLISVSTDPQRDTPAVLKKWGERFDRQNGWTLVTGDENVMKELLMSLTGKEPGQGLHTSFLILFDEASGAWETSSSLIEPKILISQLKELGKVSAK